MGKKIQSLRNLFQKKNKEKTSPVDRQTHSGSLDQDGDNNSTTDDNGPKRKDAIEQSSRRRIPSTETRSPYIVPKSRSDFLLRSSQSEDNLNHTSDHEHIGKTTRDCLRNSHGVFGSDDFVERLKNMPRRCNRQRDRYVRHRPMLSSDSTLLKGHHEYPLLPSPTHSDTTWDNMSTKRRQRICTESRLSTRSLQGENIESVTLTEKRRQRQRYHAERKRLAAIPGNQPRPFSSGTVNSSSSSSRSTSVDSNHSLEWTPQTSVVDIVAPIIPNVHETAKYERPPQDDWRHHDVVSAQTSVLRLDHEDAVSLQSFSTTSTLERHNSRDRGGQNSDQHANNSNDANQIIHYHLTIQNCDGMNIYVNNPAGTGFSPGAIQVDDAGLSKTLSWVQAPAGHSLVVPIAAESQQAYCNLSNAVNGVQHNPHNSTFRSEFGNQSQVQCSLMQNNRDNTGLPRVSNGRNQTSCEFKSAGMTGLASGYPWHCLNAAKSTLANHVRTGRYKSFVSSRKSCSTSTASQTSQSQSTQSMQTEPQSSVAKQHSITSQTDVVLPAQVDHDQKVPKVRPVAHVSPHRRNIQSTNQSQRTSSIRLSRNLDDYTSTQSNASNIRTQSVSNSQSVPSSHVASGRYQLQLNPHEQLPEPIALSSNSSTSLSSLTTEALLEADANGYGSASDPETTMDNESFSSSDSASSVLERPNNDSGRLSRRDQSSSAAARSSVRPEITTTYNNRGVSAERYTVANHPNSSSVQPSPAFRRIQSMREAGRRGGGDTVPPQYAAIRRELARVPGVLIVSFNQDRLVVYLSRDRPNVEGVVRFMVSHGVTQDQYDCQVMPYRVNNTIATDTSPATTIPVQSR